MLYICRISNKFDLNQATRVSHISIITQEKISQTTVSLYFNFPLSTSRKCYKNFYNLKLRLFIISQSVCPWQAFPAQPNACGQGQESTLEWSTRKVVHSGRLWYYSKMLDKAGKACQGQTLQLIMKRDQCYKIVYSRNLQMFVISQSACSSLV